LQKHKACGTRKIKAIKACCPPQAKKNKRQMAHKIKNDAAMG
jgi:hypothetical protein